MVTATDTDIILTTMVAMDIMEAMAIITTITRTTIIDITTIIITRTIIIITMAATTTLITTITIERIHASRLGWALLLGQGRGLRSSNDCRGGTYRYRSGSRIGLARQELVQRPFRLLVREGFLQRRDILDAELGPFIKLLVVHPVDTKYASFSRQPKRYRILAAATELSSFPSAV